MKSTLRLFILLLALLALPGCGGCGKTDPNAGDDDKLSAAEKLKKAKEKLRDPLEAKSAAVQPVSGGGNSCKPGHWMSGVLTDALANREDFQGALELRVVDGANNQQLAPLYASAYDMTTSRTAVLAKDHPKTLESYFWTPTDLNKADPTRPDAKKYSLETRLAAGRGGLEISQSFPLHAMPSYQYFFVVFSRKPARYEYLEKRMASIRPRRTDAAAGQESYLDVVENNNTSQRANYRVSFIDPKGRAKLPSNALYWTSIAVLLWDDADPMQLDPQQQTALLDWLHWGGRIIVSGPDSMDALRASFLAPYLPAEATGTRKLDDEDLDVLGEWVGEGSPSPKAGQGWSALALRPKPDAHNVLDPGKDLVIEKNVGRGTITLTAFRLSTKELLDWKYYDSFFNACLLGRKSRVLRPGEKENELVATETTKQDAKLNTGLRYFSRDEQRDLAEYGPDVSGNEKAQDERFNLPQSSIDGTMDTAAVEEAGGPGIAAWNDFGPVANAARKTLVDAAATRVPDRGFIVKIVVAYLILLVPLNWLVFRAIGRVEWAWVAAPMIAIGGTVAVIRLAQLNLGFAQAQHEVDIVEMHSGYPRAHVTRYTVLYTSLASAYDFHMSDPFAQIMPFPLVSQPGEYRPVAWQTRRTLDCRRNEATDVSGFYVASNSIDYVHSETMADLGGTIVLGKSNNGRISVTNHTKLKLTSCRVIRSNGKGLPGTIVDLKDLPPEGSSRIDFATGKLTSLAAITDLAKAAQKKISELANGSRPVPDGIGNAVAQPAEVNAQDGRSPVASESPTIETPGQPTGELTLDRLEKIAVNPADMSSGEIRFIARTDTALDGFNVTPSPAPQDIHRATLVVVTLEPGQHDKPQVDKKP